MAALIILYASYHNYPGGVAFTQLHTIGQEWRNHEIKVHLDASSAISGVSRFGQQFRAWEYHKKEDLISVEDFNDFDFILTSDPYHSSKQVYKESKLF